MRLKYVVITSVDRDDLRDGGARHFVDCIRAVRTLSPATKIEILTPDFRGRLDRALAILNEGPPDVMNHNLETVPRLYRQARPGSDYAHSLALLRGTSSGPSPGAHQVGADGRLGATNAEILDVCATCAPNDVDMLTHRPVPPALEASLAVERFVHPDDFRMFEEEAGKNGFVNAACGPMVRFELSCGPTGARRGCRLTGIRGAPRLFDSHRRQEAP